LGGVASQLGRVRQLEFLFDAAAVRLDRFDPEMSLRLLDYKNLPEQAG